MSKKAKYGLIIAIIIILAALVCLFIFNKTKPSEPIKTVNVEVNLPEAQMIEKIKQEQKVAQENLEKDRDRAREDVARRMQAEAAKRAQTAASTTPTASSTGNINIK